MNKLRLLWVAVIGLIVINLALLLFLFTHQPGPMPPHGPGPGRRPEGPKRIIMERLHFDEQQVTAYEALIVQHRKAIRELEGEITDTRTSLYLTLSDTAHTGKDSLQHRLAELQEQIDKVHYDHFNDIRKLCRPDQLSYFSHLTHDLADLFSPEKNLPPPPPKD